MSRHEGVSCDSCQKSNFIGNRFKCLVCYDYDLCAACHAAGATSPRHTADHPMQCLLTQADYELFHGGEPLGGVEHLHQSYTCPICGRLGLTESHLQEHVSIEHSGSAAEVVCPICACYSGGDPNQAMDDLAAHLMLEHRGPSELLAGMRSVRRIPHHASGGGGRSGGGGGGGATRSRRSNAGGSGAGAGGAAMAVMPPTERQRAAEREMRERESMDPIAELLSHLSSRRSHAAAQSQTISSQLLQLEMQLQSTRPQTERLLPIHQETFRSTATVLFPQSSSSSAAAGAAEQAAPAASASMAPSGRNHGAKPVFLLSRLESEAATEEELERSEGERVLRSLCLTDLLLSSIAELPPSPPPRPQPPPAPPTTTQATLITQDQTFRLSPPPVAQPVPASPAVSAGRVATTAAPHGAVPRGGADSGAAEAPDPRIVHPVVPTTVHAVPSGMRRKQLISRTGKEQPAGGKFH